MDGYLAGVRRLCDQHGIVFILDDVRAGFRLDLRGSGTFFGVEPDLTSYCKAIANGYALSACLGREMLRGAAERVFFTGSYFTSGVPMAAALACLNELEGSGGIEHMNRIGQLLRDGLDRQARAHRLEIRQSGPAAIPFLTFAADEGKFARSRVFCCGTQPPRCRWSLPSRGALSIRLRKAPAARCISGRSVRRATRR